MFTFPVIYEEEADYMKHDRLTKKLIQEFFEEFIEAFFPNLHPHIDFSNVSFLEQEVYLDYINGRKKEIDVLAEVKLNHEDKILHIHTEAQSTHEADFPERMFLYFSLSSSKRQKLGDFTSRPTISQHRLLPSSCFLYLSCAAPISTFLNGHFPLFSPLRQTPQTHSTHRCFEL
ncbi:hypothetical protein [Oceanobacillus oncorhynchi]|uniref:hypothetical protein n=1 Tax=Oceanobacillus oncorhynchi TaxID=545501 RepID=UPI001BB3BF0E|nr:hypothetical protein [Oceanobacillus oncorhynchi]